MGQDDNLLPETRFRNIFILESRAWWPAILAEYDPALDLVLTFDFALRREVEALGGTARYVDHLCKQSDMQANNFRMYEFFRTWHLDSEGGDIFRYRNVDFGISFRIEIWNDLTFYVRNWLCLAQLRNLQYKALHVGCGVPAVTDVLSDMGLSFSVVSCDQNAGEDAYFFPTHRWMDERLRIRRLRHVLRDVIVPLQGVIMSLWDRLVELGVPKTRVFVQEYYPTRQLMYQLMQQKGLRVIQAHFSAASGIGKLLCERPIPIYGFRGKYKPIAEKMMRDFAVRRAARLVLTTGDDVTEAVLSTILTRVTDQLPQSLRALDCISSYLDKHPLRLEILMGNLGQLSPLIDSVAKSRNVPSYLIINGILGNAYLDEAKYATVINSYSTSIRDNYFRGMDNIVCLGDPRMDDYALLPPKKINRESPTITIGSSGFSNVDLNSYLAVEFEFLDQVLTAIQRLRSEGMDIKVCLKVRSNGYQGLYRGFVDEYFAGAVNAIVDNVPMSVVLADSDFFVSLYSQTLFEASCMGIPCVYHKNDREIMDAPFDGRSELVTTYNTADFEQALRDFVTGSDRFDAFLKKEVMQKYIGPLDGRNLERNERAVRLLLDQSIDDSAIHCLRALQ